MSLDFLHADKLSPAARKDLRRILHTAIFVLSVLLIIFISYEIFNDVAFLNDHAYMTFQFWVCLFFMLDYAVGIWMAPDRRRYAWRNIGFFLISIPYLNIIDILGIDPGVEVLYYIRFIPLIRGAWAMAIVVSYVSTNRIVGIFASYLSIMLLVLYFASILFYSREHPVNPGVPTYWSSLWWCSLEMTTIGAPVNPFTPTGKVLAAILSGMGMIMFPLFTVYLTQMLRKYLRKQSAPATPAAVTKKQGTTAVNP